MAASTPTRPAAPASASPAAASPNEAIAATRKIVSILFIGGALSAIAAIFSLAYANFGAAAVRLTLGVLQIVLALHLGKRTAAIRIVTLVWFGLVMVFMIFRVLRLKHHIQVYGANAHPGNLIATSLICFGVAAWAYWTLTRPNVRAAFK
jgi:uncharacterized YccA/Bax inhibitor family protein